MAYIAHSAVQRITYIAQPEAGNEYYVTMAVADSEATQLSHLVGEVWTNILIMKTEQHAQG